MKKRYTVVMLMVFLLAGLLGSTITNAQAGKLPPFRMQQANGKIFKAEDLPFGKPIVIIYFSPDCDHCENLTKELIKNKTDFKNVSVAMVTYLGVEEVSKFVQRHQLAAQPNVYVGTEGTTYFLKNYYKITTLPFMALYTKNGDLVQSYPKEGSLPDLLKQLKTLK